jgi:hypothetical protein
MNSEERQTFDPIDASVFDDNLGFVRDSDSAHAAP